MNIYKAYSPPSSTGGAYLKLQDNVAVEVRIFSEPVVFESDYKGKTSTRYAWVVWNIEEKSAQVMVLPVTAYRLIAEYGADDDWDLNTCILKVTRRGTGKETKYYVMPKVAKEELTEEETLELKGINLISAVEASPTSSNAMWLRDVVEGKTPAPRQDVALEDIDDPINLEDIPFD